MSISLLDVIIQDFEIRFKAKDSGVIDELRKLIPKMVEALEKVEVDNMVDVFHLQYHSSSFWVGKILCSSEILLWRKKWTRGDEPPSNGLSALD